MTEESLNNIVEKSRADDNDYTMLYWTEKKKIMDRLKKRQEHEKLVEETAQRVLSRIHTTVDTKELFGAIDGLNEKIKSLGK